jgi:hypothetical protein
MKTRACAPWQTEAHRWRTTVNTLPATPRVFEIALGICLALSVEGLTCYPKIVGATVIDLALRGNGSGRRLASVDGSMRKQRVAAGLRSPAPWARRIVIVGAMLGAATRPARAETTTPETPSTGAPAIRMKPRITGIHLDTQTGWSLGLEGYAGLATLSTNEGTKGHALVGGLSRARIGFAEIGAGLELSDDAGERWRTFGGSVGAYLPFTNWVDIDATLGLALRSYVSSDGRYGPTGATARTPALTMRLGVSDRTVEGLIGPRLGAALLVGIDLKHPDVTWSYGVPGKTPVVGVSHFGGVTAALVVSFGFDLALRSTSER